MPRSARRRRLTLLLLALLLLAGSVLLTPGCAYLAQAATGHLELMAGRVPLRKALQREDLSEQERDRLLFVERIKRFGEQEVGLSPTKNYETVNLDFDRVVWNVSGCAEDRFESHMYRYPIVGALSYSGWFDREDAEREAERLRAHAWEPYIRPAGAYSTLGWFKDPLWRSMLRWDVEQFANTVLHELAHATLWLKGHGRFNESLAGFVGDEASARFMASIRDERPEAFQAWEDREEDSARYRAFMHDLVGRLEGLYRSGLPRDEVLRRKAETIEQARARYAALPWKREGYRKALDDRGLNNAALVQFRVYNTGTDRFAEALSRFGGDLPAFLDAVRTLPEQQKRGGRDWDPYAALDALRPD